MERLPAFDFEAYRRWLPRLQEAGYRLCAVGDGVSATPTVHLRHDIDFFIEPAMEMARIESALGVRATYYVLLTGPYNPMAADNAAALRELTAMGHEIGLHYDLSTFPDAPPAARAELDNQVALLSKLCAAKVTTISTHQPHLGGVDPFRSLDEYLHPHDPRNTEPVLYVSDSCRGWRDENLLTCLSGAPPVRVVWLTHPELWLDGRIKDRFRYLHTVLWPRASAKLREYYRQEVVDIWRNHAGAKAHDAREGLRQPQTVLPDKAWVEINSEALLARFEQFVELPWNRESLLFEVPGKWQNSLVLLGPDADRNRVTARDIHGFAFNSLRDGDLYVHAFFVSPEHRGRAIGRYLLDALFRHARENDLPGIQLRVDVGNDRAIQWYLNAGFSIVSDASPAGTIHLRLAVQARS